MENATFFNNVITSRTHERQDKLSVIENNIFKYILQLQTFQKVIET